MYDFCLGGSRIRDPLLHASVAPLPVVAGLVFHHQDELDKKKTRHLSKPVDENGSIAMFAQSHPPLPRAFPPAFTLPPALFCSSNRGSRASTGCSASPPPTATSPEGREAQRAWAAARRYLRRVPAHHRHRLAAAGPRPTNRSLRR